MIAQIRLLLLLVASALVAVGSAHPDLEVYDGSQGIVSVNINKMFDQMVPEIQKRILKDSLDPLPMCNYWQELHGLLGFQGYLSMTNGWLVGLSTISRGDDIILSYGKKTLTLDISLKLDVLNLMYNYYIEYANLWKKGTFNGGFKTLKLRTVLYVDFNTYKISLGLVKITSLQKVEVKLVGNAIDNVVNAVMKVVLNVFKQNVVYAVEQNCAATFRRALGEINGMIPKPGSYHLAKHVEYEFLNNVPTTFNYTLI